MASSFSMWPMPMLSASAPMDTCARTCRSRRFATPDADVRLKPFRPKALYLSVYGIGDRKLRTAALALLETTELNALVIDLKGDRGLVPYRSAIALATRSRRAARHHHRRSPGIGDRPASTRRSTRSRGSSSSRTICWPRDGRPWPCADADGSIFRDREGLAWTNPYSHDVWNYNIGIAVEAAKAGFDEIQFDYVRLPDATGLVYEMPWTEQNREAAIDGFLTRGAQGADALQRLPGSGRLRLRLLEPRRHQDRPEAGAPGGNRRLPLADALSVELSVRHPGLPQPGRTPLPDRSPVARTSPPADAPAAGALPPVAPGVSRLCLRRPPFTAGEIRAQIKAAEDFGADGWMLWNPHNQYSAADLKP